MFLGKVEVVQTVVNRLELRYWTINRLQLLVERTNYASSTLVVVVCRSHDVKTFRSISAHRRQVRAVLQPRQSEAASLIAGPAVTPSRCSCGQLIP